MRHLNESSNRWKDWLDPFFCCFIIILLGKKIFCWTVSLLITRMWQGICEGGRSCMVGHVCLVKHKNLVDKVSSSESPRRTWKSNILSYSRVLTVDLMASNQLWWFTTLYVTYGWTKIYSLRLHHLLYFFSCDTQFTFTIWNKVLRTCKEKFKSI